MCGDAVPRRGVTGGELGGVACGERDGAVLEVRAKEAGW